MRDLVRNAKQHARPLSSFASFFTSSSPPSSSSFSSLSSSSSSDLNDHDVQRRAVLAHSLEEILMARSCKIERRAYLRTSVKILSSILTGHDMTEEQIQRLQSLLTSTSSLCPPVCPPPPPPHHHHHHPRHRHHLHPHPHHCLRLLLHHALSHPYHLKSESLAKIIIIIN